LRSAGEINHGHPAEGGGITGEGKVKVKKHEFTLVCRTTAQG